VDHAALPVIVGFTVFRILDAVKPWPIRLIDARIPGGLGVMLDDVLAGILTLVVLEISF
jgi:phosphatidylglycerophosphatase A